MHDLDPVPFVVPEGGGVLHENAGRPYREVASFEQTGAYQLLDNAAEPGYRPHGAHWHDASEAFYVLEGSYTVFVDDEEFEVEAGGFVFIPRRARHTYVAGPAGGRKLTVTVSDSGKFEIHRD